MNAKFTFKPLTISDLDLLCRWFEKPHVLEWWSDRFTPEEIKENMENALVIALFAPISLI